MSNYKALNTLDTIAFAWRSSEGISGLVRSFDFWVACAVWALAAPAWLAHDWPDQVLGVLPNLLGFTLGGFAIFLGFGGDGFKRLMSESGREGISTYESVSAAFIYFVVFQLTALLWALVAKAAYRITAPNWLAELLPLDALALLGAAVGYWLFVYSLMIVLRAAIRVFKMSRWHALFLTQVGEHDPPAR